MDSMQRMYSHVQQPYKFIGTKEIVYIRKEQNSHRIGLVYQHGRHFIVLEHSYGCGDVMCIPSVLQLACEHRQISSFCFTLQTGTVEFTCQEPFLQIVQHETKIVSVFTGNPPTNQARLSLPVIGSSSTVAFALGLFHSGLSTIRVVIKF